MALDMFMRIEGVNGESKDANHKDWTDIRSFTWGAEQPGSMNTGGGGGAGDDAYGLWVRRQGVFALSIKHTFACQLCF